MHWCGWPFALPFVAAPNRSPIGTEQPMVDPLACPTRLDRLTGIRQFGGQIRSGPRSRRAARRGGMEGRAQRDPGFKSLWARIAVQHAAPLDGQRRHGRTSTSSSRRRSSTRSSGSRCATTPRWCRSADRAPHLPGDMGRVISFRTFLPSQLPCRLLLSTWWLLATTVSRFWKRSSARTQPRASSSVFRLHEAGEGFSTSRSRQRPTIGRGSFRTQECGKPCAQQ